MESAGWVLEVFFSSSSFLQVVILATCNRLEIYGIALDTHDARQPIIGLLVQTCSVTESDIEKYFYTHTDEAAVRYLFTVAVGLDSMLVGEAQILGQVCDALQLAHQTGTAGAILSHLFQNALTTGKAARTQTNIGRGALSLGYAAVEQARAIFDDEPPRNVLVIGAGEMAESVAGCLAANHIGPVIVANRAFERACALAQKFDGRAMALRQRPLCLIDIAVPRDIDPQVAQIENVQLFNIDPVVHLKQPNNGWRQEDYLEIARALFNLDEAR